jgi:hypothetical protein
MNYQTEPSDFGSLGRLPKSKYVLVVITLALVASTSGLLLTGCSGDKTPSKGDVVVFVAVPLSGFMANGGQTVLGGVRLAVMAACWGTGSSSALWTTKRTATWRWLR